MAVDSGANPSQMDFWDGMEPVFWMPSITPTERKVVWDAVAGCIQQQLLLHKGIRIPTLGSFDVVPTEVLVENRSVILQRPVFHLARNLGGVQNLEKKDDPAGGKRLEPLRYARVAAEAGVARRKAACCVLGTTSLLCRCLEKGVSAAFVLRDLGVLLIHGSSGGKMRFYPEFLEKVVGERMKDGATLKVLQQLDMVVSQEVPIASLSSTGPVIIFPNFEQTFLPASLPGDRLKEVGFVPGEDKSDKICLSPIRRGMEGRVPGLPMTAGQGSTAKAGEQPWDEEATEKSRSCRARKLPVIPGAAPEGKQPVTGQAKGKPVPKGQAPKQRDKKAAETQRGRGGRGERKDALGREGEKNVQIGKEGERRDSLGREGERRDSLGKEGERRDSLGREGERRDSLSREGESRDSLSREGERRDSLRKEGERRDYLRKKGERNYLRKEGESRDYLRKGERNNLRKDRERRDLRKEGEKKIGRGKEKKAKDAVRSEGEKKVGPKREENKVSPRRTGEKKVPLERGEKQVPLGREGENFRLRREDVKYLLGRLREQNLLPGREGERRAPLGSASLPRRAQARRAQDPKVFILQQPQAPQALRARPEAFWSVLREPQKSILAGYSFEPSRLLPPLPLRPPVLKKRETVCRGPWPWVE